MTRAAVFSAVAMFALLLVGCPNEEVKAEQQRIGGAPKNTIDTMKNKANAAVKKTEDRLNANLKAADEAQ